MKIVVIGGTGLIGSKLVAKLGDQGHEALAAAPNTGVDTLTGEGVAEALAGADVVVDVSNSPSFDEQAVLDFFTTSTTNLLDAAKAAGVRHYVALSVVGTDRLLDSGYFRAKLLQEDLVKESGIPYTIVRSTQFFEFMRGIAGSSMDSQIVRLSPALTQPIAADDVAEALAQAAVRAPINGMLEVAGPEPYRLSDIVGRVLAETHDERLVVADPDAPYFGVQIEERTLVPGGSPYIAPTSLDAWLASGQLRV